ncbi:MAG TPA: cellulose biosynthesis protein BcsS [Aestuariivirgaceae bacterium]|nr:cellulose biosynthesis protein BcsS [Aestuariivirgaceae bacterium]
MGGRRQSFGLAQGRGGALLGVAFAACLALSGAPNDATAGEGFALVGVGAGLGGLIGGDDNGLHGFAGVIYAPGHSLSDTGFVLRGWAKGLDFEYHADLPGAPDSRISVLGYGFQVEAGWQFAGPRGRIALLPGVAWRDHELTPSDPGSRLEDDRFGVSLTADGELRFGERFGVMANGMYLTGFEEYWAQARPFVDVGSGWKLGLDFAGWGGPDYARMRAGVFTSGYELPFRIFGRTFLGASAGVQSDTDGKHMAPFAGINIGVLF